MDNHAQHDRWLRVAAHLRVDRKQNMAPHKPLLLLVVAELAEDGNLKTPVLLLTGELTFRFLTFWTVVANRRSQRPDIRLPFFHMHSDGCWSLLDSDGKHTTDRFSAVTAHMDEGFFACLNDPPFREQLRRILIAKYFTDPGERAGLYDLVGLPIPSDDVVKADAHLYAESRQRGREARFHLTVIPAYKYACALTGYRCDSVKGENIVDAAHIHEFKDSRNNDPRNGMALSKNAHWQFDRGLWSLSDDYRVIVSTDRFKEAGPDHLLLGTMTGRRILLPENPAFWPDKAHLEWHRKHTFGRGPSDR